MNNERANILFIGADERDKTELSHERFTEKYRFYFYDYKIVANNRIPRGIFANFNPEEVLEELTLFIREKNIDAIISSEDYPGSLFASVLTEKFGLVGPSIESLLICQHKYYSRIYQQQIVAEATPAFQLLSSNTEQISLAFPLFIKPVKAYFSIFAEKILNYRGIYSLLNRPPQVYEFFTEFNWFLEKYTSFSFDKKSLLAEEYLSGIQVTYEGFICNDKCTTIGIVDSIMYPGTLCFKRFEYPSSLSSSVQKRMAEIAEKFMRYIKFDNGIFNIEFMYNPRKDSIHIVEVNPRLAAQFSDLYEKVDGRSNFDHGLDIIMKNRAHVFQRRGVHNLAASFVLRVFADKHVVKIPSLKEEEIFYTKFPDGRFFNSVRKNHLLSEEFQDGKSFKYALIHLGARDEQELSEKFACAKKILSYQFVDPIRGK